MVWSEPVNQIKSKPVDYCQMDPWEHFCLTFWATYSCFHLIIYVENCRLENEDHFLWT